MQVPEQRTNLLERGWAPTHSGVALDEKLHASVSKLIARFGVSFPAPSGWKTD